MSKKETINLDDVDVLEITCSSTAIGSFLMSLATGSLDVVNAAIRVASVDGKNSTGSYVNPVLVKEYTIGSGLTPVEGTSLRWQIDMVADGLSTYPFLVFDGYVTNVAQKRRNFRGVFKINNVVAWS
jgi:hypothetical protein